MAGKQNIRKRKPNLTRLAMSLGLLLFLAFILFPVLWTINGSLQKRVDLFSKPPVWIPKSLYLENYKEVLRDPTFLRSIGNSALVAIATTILALMIGSLAAYTFVRLRLPGKETIFLGILICQMLPSVMILIPMYILLRRLGLLYTYQGLILSYLAFSIPYVIWLLRAYFLSIPPEIEEAALVDGCSRLGAIFRIFLPLSAPGFLSTAIFAFVGAWNEMMIASIITNNATKTMTVRIAQFVGEETTAYQHMFSAAVIGTLPVLILAFLFQPYIVRGLTQGGVKQ